MKQKLLEKIKLYKMFLNFKKIVFYKNLPVTFSSDRFFYAFFKGFYLLLSKILVKENKDISFDGIKT